MVSSFICYVFSSVRVQMSSSKILSILFYFVYRHSVHCFVVGLLSDIRGTLVRKTYDSPVWGFGLSVRSSGKKNGNLYTETPSLLDMTCRQKSKHFIFSVDRVEASWQYSYYFMNAGTLLRTGYHSYSITIIRTVKKIISREVYHFFRVFIKEL